MSRARSCRCGSHADQHEIRDSGKGEQIAVTCTKCLRFVSQRCRVCRRDYRDLGLHHAKSECGRFDKAGMWWTADRPPNAGAATAGASQPELPGVA